jgi:putative hydrolase of the HAD superfamily
MAIRAIVFDLDDTLVVDEAAAQTALRATCVTATQWYGIDAEELYGAVRKRARELWRGNATVASSPCCGMSSWEALRSDFPGADPLMSGLRQWAPKFRFESWLAALGDCGLFDPVLAQELACQYPREREARHETFPDAPAAVADLARDYKLALVTNGPSDLQRGKLFAAGLEEFFPVIVVSAEVGIWKPDPRIFDRALGPLGVKPAEAAMVGDMVTRDVGAAQAAGLRGIWLDRAADGGIAAADRRADSSGDTRPDATIKTLAELRAAIAALPA